MQVLLWVAGLVSVSCTENKVLQSSSAPQSSPIRSVVDLLEWTPGHDSSNVAFVPLAVREHSSCASVSAPQLMLCHDMNGGYNEDRFPQGGDESFVYNFFYWPHIDQFVYFSHHRITIPPPVWTNAAHKNGVQMLGTLLLENHNDVDQEFLLLMYGPCHGKSHQQILASDTLSQICTADNKKSDMFFADQLVAIAKYYGFEGWLLNFETPVPGSDASFQRLSRRSSFGTVDQNVRQLKKWVKHLTDAMRAHDCNSKVIWYDSITTSGNVNYQNVLDRENKDFFDITSGFFTNYWWEPSFLDPEEKLAESNETSSSNSLYTSEFSLPKFRVKTHRGSTFRSRWRYAPSRPYRRIYDFHSFLEQTKRLVAKGKASQKFGRSAEILSARNFDVYVGNDVYGRGTYGGGGFATSTALDVITRHHLSASLFAQAWAYEAIRSKVDGKNGLPVEFHSSNRTERFQKQLDLRKKFWEGSDDFSPVPLLFDGTKWSAYPQLSKEAEPAPTSPAVDSLGDDAKDNGEELRGENGSFRGVAAFFPPHIAPSKLPFVSGFDQGLGDKLAVEGEVVALGEWSLLSQQDLQPTFRNNKQPGGISMYISQKNSYNGGSCLRFSGTSTSTERLFFPVFKTKIFVSEPLVVSYSVSTKDSTCRKSSLFLELEFQDGTLLSLDSSKSAVLNNREPEPEQQQFAKSASQFRFRQRVFARHSISSRSQTQSKQGQKLFSTAEQANQARLSASVGSRGKIENQIGAKGFLGARWSGWKKMNSLPSKNVLPIVSTPGFKNQEWTTVRHTLDASLTGKTIVGILVHPEHSVGCSFLADLGQVSISSVSQDKSPPPAAVKNIRINQQGDRISLTWSAETTVSVVDGVAIRHFDVYFEGAGNNYFVGRSFASSYWIPMSALIGKGSLVVQAVDVLGRRLPLKHCAAVQYDGKTKFYKYNVMPNIGDYATKS